MHNIEIPEKNACVEIPSSWNELSVDQFAFVMKTHHEFIEMKGDSVEFYTTVLYYLLGLKPDTFLQKALFKARKSFENKTKSIHRIEEKNSNIYQLTELLHFILNDNNQINIDSFKNKVPVLSNGFYGPADSLIDCTCNEYFSAFSFYVEYTKTKNEDYLFMMIACLYWPRRSNLDVISKNESFDGRERMHYNANFVEKHAFLIKKSIMPWEKTAILSFFVQSDSNLKKGSICIDGKNVSFAPIFKKEEETKNTTSTGAASNILLSVAETNVFGSIEKVEKQNICTVLNFLLMNKKTKK